MRSFPYSTAAVAPWESHTREELEEVRGKMSKWQYSLHKTAEPPIAPINAVFRGTAWDALKLIALWAESIEEGTWPVVLQAMRGVLEPRLLKSSEHVCTRRLPCKLLCEADLTILRMPWTPPAHTTTFVEGRWYTARSGGILYIKHILSVAALFMTIRVHLLCPLKEGKFALQSDVKLTVKRGLAAPILRQVPLLPLMFRRSKFEGRIEGLVFKTGIYGTGYYLDAKETIDAYEYCETFETNSRTFLANDGKAYTGRYLRTP